MKARKGIEVQEPAIKTCRPAVSVKRLALTNSGKVPYELKTPYRDGTTHVFFEPQVLICV